MHDAVVQTPDIGVVRFGEAGPLWFFDESPRRVNNCIVRLMIREAQPVARP